MIKSSCHHSSFLHKKGNPYNSCRKSINQSQQALKGEVKNIYPCNATFCWKPRVCFADQAQGRALPAGQHTWPHHKNCSGMCEEHDEDLKALNWPPEFPRSQFDGACVQQRVRLMEAPTSQPAGPRGSASRCPGAKRRRTSQEVLCLCFDRLELVWSHNTSPHVVLPSCTAVIDFTKPDNSECHNVPDTSCQLSRATWLSTSNKLLARLPRSTALPCCLLWLKCHYAVLITSPLRRLVTAKACFHAQQKAGINKLAMCCWWVNPFTSGRSCPWRSL